MRDDTLVTFTSTDASANVTVTRDDHAGAVEPYAQAQEQALIARRLKGYRAQVSSTKIGGFDVVVVDREFVDGSTAVAQRQAFVGGPRGLVVIVTGSAVGRGNAAVHRAVEALVSSLTIDAAGVSP